MATRVEHRRHARRSSCRPDQRQDLHLHRDRDQRRRRQLRVDRVRVRGPGDRPERAGPADATPAAPRSSVTFSAPVDGGSTITGYTASCTSSNGGAAGSNTGGDVADRRVQRSPTARRTRARCTRPTPTATAPTSAASARDDADDGSGRARRRPRSTRGNAPDRRSRSRAPANDGSPITGYTANCTSTDGGTSGSNTGAIVADRRDRPRPTARPTRARSSRPTASATAPRRPRRLGDPAHRSRRTGRAHRRRSRQRRSIAVTFSHRPTVAATITGYTASCTSSDGGAAGSNTGGSSPITVQRPHQRQDVHLHGQRHQRRRRQLAASSASSRPSFRQPSRRARATVDDVGNGQISVTFAAPSNGGSTITGYTASCTSSDGGAPGPNTGATSPITVIGSPTARPTPAPSSRPTAKGTAPRRRVGHGRAARFPTRPPRRRSPSATADLGERSSRRSTTAPRSPATPRPARRATAARRARHGPTHRSGRRPHQRQDLHLHGRRHERRR